MHSIGIDIGSSAIKSCVLDARNRTVFFHSSFHHGNIKSELIQHLQKTANEIDGKEAFFSVTGEQAKAFTKLTPYFINDIPAIVEGCLFTDSEARSIMEIGAQNSRFITNFSNDDKSNIKFHMNTSCSAGTGSFLEEQASRLNIGLENLSAYTDKGKKAIRIAGRCSVFSKTDMIHHQQEGAAIEDILLGLIFAMVRNYKATVVKKTKITPPVFLAGGVMHNKSAIRAVKEIFRLPKDQIAFSENYNYMGAIGSAVIAKKQNKTITTGTIANVAGDDLKPLALSTIHLSLKKFGDNDNVGKHLCKPDKNATEGFLGIDIGSTSTNLVLIDENHTPLAYRYLRTIGRPSDVVEQGLESLRQEFGPNFKIKSIGTTGSGRYLIGKQTGADVIENEISAQAEGALCLDPEVDTIFEIGGQDSKYIRLKDGVVVDFAMNKICAAGTGTFIEEQALKLGVGIDECGKIAMEGDNPVELGERCTVFIEGSITNALAQGESKNDIIAGLSYSIVKNYLNKVVGNRRIGDRIFLQGGIAYNQGVVNAFRALTGKKIIVPEYFSVTGAYGIAILTLKKYKSTENEKKPRKIPVNIFRESEELFLEGYDGTIDENKLTIGIPRVLFMHKLFVLFNVFFKSLGFNVLLSDATDKKIVDASQSLQMDETCYPVKLINGHVASLMEKGVDYIFLPRLHTMQHNSAKTRMDYACVYMQTSPLLMAHALDIENSRVKLLSPEFSFKAGKAYMAKTLLSLGPEIGKSRFQTALALRKGVARILEYNKKMENSGKNAINSLRENEIAFVIITRPYGVTDPELNMNIPDLLIKKGYNVLALSNLGVGNYDLSQDYPNMYWPFGQHILAGARIIRENPNLYAIYLTNHGCGPDTVLAHQFEKEMTGKPYLHIEVDEHFSEVGVITRIEAFINSVTTQPPIPSLNKNKKIKARHKEKSTQDFNEKLYIPNLYPYSQLLCELFNADDKNAEVLSETCRESFEEGKKFSISKEYLSLVSVMGDVMYKAGRLRQEKSVFWVPKNEGSETFGQYEKLITDRLHEVNENSQVESPFLEDLLMSESYGTNLLLALLAGDIIMTATPQMRDTYLKQISLLIKDKKLTLSLLKMLAEEIYARAEFKNDKKTIFVTGEISVVFNPFNNNFEVKKLEESHRLLFQPLSETLYVMWNDHGRELKNSAFKKRLSVFKDQIDTISQSLKELSPFDEDIDELIIRADDMLRLYSGGNGRYRLAKMLRYNGRTDGMISMESMYENTGVILRILSDKYQADLKKSILNLTFDGSSYSSHEDLINNFLFYL